MKNLGVSEMWMFRIILSKISSIDRITSRSEVLEKTGQTRELLTIVKKNKLSYLGRIVRYDRYYELLQEEEEGNIK